MASCGHTLIRRAAAGVLLLGTTLPLARPVAAQSRGTDVRMRDSVILRTFRTDGGDTVIALLRTLDRESYGSPGWLTITHQLDSLMLGTGRHIMLRATHGQPGAAAGPAAVMPKGWIGILPQGPSQQVVDDDGLRVTYFAYPLILSVDPESPAERAGIAPGDVLVAYNGLDVVGREINLTRLLVPEKKIAVTVRRDGEKKDYSVDVMKVPEAVLNRRVEFDRVPMSGRIIIEHLDGDDDMPMRHPMGNAIVSLPRTAGPTTRTPLMANGFMVVSAHGVFGASMSTVGADLARALKLEKGMLVNDVPEQSPAFKSGLRAGDVIISAAGQPVTSLNALQDVVVAHLGERSVALQVVRDRKPARITVTW